MAIRISKNAMSLRGLTILVGKNPNADNILISVEKNGKNRKVLIPDCGKVPQSVSRCFPEQGIAHCKIYIDEKGLPNVTNLKSQNITLIDKLEVVTRKTDESKVLELGKDRFRISIRTIINAAAMVTESPLSKCIKAKVQYDKAIVETTSEARIKYGKCNTMILLAILAWICTIIFKKTDLGYNYGLVAFIVAAITSILIVVYHAILYRMKHISQREKIIDEYIQKCSCPKCGHFLGDKDTGEMEQLKTCPECNSLLDD